MTHDDFNDFSYLTSAVRYEQISLLKKRVLSHATNSLAAALDMFLLVGETSFFGHPHDTTLHVFWEGSD